MRTEIFMRAYGRLWSGPRACYQYKLDATPADDAAAKRAAGDFESLIDYHVTQVSTTYESAGRGLSRRVETFKTLRGWRNGFSDARYNRAANA